MPGLGGEPCHGTGWFARVAGLSCRTGERMGSGIVLGQRWPREEEGRGHDDHVSSQSLFLDEAMEVCLWACWIDEPELQNGDT